MEEQLRAEALAQEGELAATVDDLHKMIRENQVVNEEVQKAAIRHEQLNAELQQAAARTSYFELLAQAKQTEGEELLATYVPSRSSKVCSHSTFTSMAGTAGSATRRTRSALRSRRWRTSGTD